MQPAQETMILLEWHMLRSLVLVWTMSMENSVQRCENKRQVEFLRDRAEAAARTLAAESGH